MAINGGPLHPHAVLWNQDVVTDLGTLGGDESVATCISDSGRIVGLSSTEPGPVVGTSGTRAFTWFHGKLMSLPPLEEGNDLEWDWTSHINKDGIVVGYSTALLRDVPFASSTAVMWQDGKIFDLNNLIPDTTDLFLIDGAAINDNGEIAAVALDGDGHAHLLLLTPANEDAVS